MKKEDPKVLFDLVKRLPTNPGVYQFFNKEEIIIYVGKAKNLKKRVSSYFFKRHENRKTEILVKQIDNIRHIIVDNEEDALILENSLIKKILSYIFINDLSKNVFVQRFKNYILHSCF